MAAPASDNVNTQTPALSGDIGTLVREQRDGGLMLTAAVPVQRYKQVLGVVMLSSGSGEIVDMSRIVEAALP